MNDDRRYTAAPTLWRMLQSDAYCRVVKGPVGSGKSTACIKEIGRRACQQAPDANGIRKTRFAVIRNTYRELKDTTRKTFEQWIPREAGDWREADFAFDLRGTLRDGTTVESEIMFRSLNRPEDVKKLLSLELTGAYINELKEIPKAVVDVLDTRIGRYPSMIDGGPTWRGWWADTNPWHVGHWGYKLFKSHKMFDTGPDIPGPPPGYELFVQPSARGPNAENVAKLDPGYYSRLCHGKDKEWIRVFIDGEDAASDVGSVFGPLLEVLERAGGIGVEYNHPGDGIFTSWDLGFTDATSIWFWRLNGEALDFVDHYESHGKPLSHFFDLVDSKGYQVVKHWLPHDAAAKTLASQSSVEDQFRARYPGKVQIGPGLSLLDGIQAGRWLLEQPCRFHPRTADGVEALRSYHYEWDEDTKTYSKKPEHDWSSHTADAFRYAAVVAKVTGLLMRKDAPPKAPVVPPADRAWNLDQLFEDNESDKSGRRRI